MPGRARLWRRATLCLAGESDQEDDLQNVTQRAGKSGASTGKLAVFGATSSVTSSDPSEPQRYRSLWQPTSSESVLGEAFANRDDVKERDPTELILGDPGCASLTALGVRPIEETPKMQSVDNAQIYRQALSRGQI